MPKVLFLTAYPVEDASCRYRVHQFIPYLQSAGYQCTISSFATPQLFRALRSTGSLLTKTIHTTFCSVRRLVMLANLSHYDLVVIHREAFPFFAPLVENWIVHRHARVIYSFDDAVYCGHAEVSRLTHPLLYRMKHGHGYDEVIRLSPYVIAGNRLLAQHAAEVNTNVSVVPTVIDCRRFWPKSIGKGEQIVIGWIGSPSTVSYLAAIEPALDEIAKRHQTRVKFRFFGCPEYKFKLPRYQCFPFNVDREPDDVRSIDIGVMPMPDTQWTRGKCAFKAIQYMSAGVPTVASPVGVTTDLIHHNVNGLLATSETEWVNELERLISDKQLCKHLSVNARRTVEEKYSLDVWGPRFVSLLNEILTSEKIRQGDLIAA